MLTGFIECTERHFHPSGKNVAGGFACTMIGSYAACNVADNH